MQTHAMILALNAMSLMDKLACGMKGNGLIGYLSFSQVENGGPERNDLFKMLQAGNGALRGSQVPCTL